MTIGNDDMRSDSPATAASDDRTPLASGPLQAALLSVRLLTELAMLAVLAIVGANAGSSLALRIALAVGLPLAAAAIWGIGIAPRARRRWRDPWRIGAEIMIFLAGAAGLAGEGSVIAAIVFAVIAIGTAIAVRVIAPGG